MIVDPVLRNAVNMYEAMEQEKLNKNIEIEMIKKTLELQKQEGEILSRMLLELEPYKGRNVNIEI